MEPRFIKRSLTAQTPLLTLSFFFSKGGMLRTVEGGWKETFYSSPAWASLGLNEV